MDIILSRYCRSFTGTISRKHGYSIRKQGDKFCSVRNSKNIPPNGHLLFIFDCAELAREGMLIADVRLMGEELIAAANEAGLEFETIVADVEYNAHDVLNIKKYYSL